MYIPYVHSMGTQVITSEYAILHVSGMHTNYLMFDLLMRIKYDDMFCTANSPSAVIT